MFRRKICLMNPQVDKLMEYARLLVEWNEKINLTAITDDEGIVTKHFLDSLTAIKTGYVKGKVIDVGTGAGFPGLVLKIAKPEIKLTLLDSLNKRIILCIKLQIYILNIQKYIIAYSLQILNIRIACP